MAHDWLLEFQKRTENRFKSIFEKDLSETPRRLIDKLEELRRAEQQMLRGKPAPNKKI